ncbi:MAG: hypothetical protein RR844_08450, partial [Clostridium sp.]
YNFRTNLLENIVGISNSSSFEVQAYTRIATAKGIPDIIIKIHNDQESIVAIIENKLKAEEGYEQTDRYSTEECLREICSNCKIKLDYEKVKFEFVYLTLIPEQIPSGEKFVNRIYKDILEKVNINIKDTFLDKIYKDFLSLMKDFYSNLDVGLQDKVLKLLCDNVDGEKVYIRFRSIMQMLTFTNGLEVNKIGKAGGAGRVSFIAQIAKTKWRSGRKAEFTDEFYNVGEDTYDIHLEFSFDILNKSIKLLLHYETNPYIPKKSLIKWSREEDYKKYNDRRELVKVKLHDKINKLGNSNIKTYNGSNQIASISIDINEETSVKEFIAIVEVYCKEITELVDEVLFEVIV